MHLTLTSASDIVGGYACRACEEAVVGTPTWSVVIDDGRTPSTTAPLQGPFEGVAERAAALGVDAVLIALNRPTDVDPGAVLVAKAR